LSDASLRVATLGSWAGGITASVAFGSVASSVGCVPFGPAAVSGAAICSALSVGGLVAMVNEWVSCSFLTRQDGDVASRRVEV
jgi:hypothetical protein